MQEEIIKQKIKEVIYNNTDEVLEFYEKFKANKEAYLKYINKDCVSIRINDYLNVFKSTTLAISKESLMIVLQRCGLFIDDIRLDGIIQNGYFHLYRNGQIDYQGRPISRKKDLAEIFIIAGIFEEEEK